jgi:hypothetical protein
MATLHGKDHDCHDYMQRHGSKRRRCTYCGHTWSVRKKRRGPKPRRISCSLPKMVLVDHEPTGRLSQRRQCSPSALYARTRHAFDRLVQQRANVTLPVGQDLVLVADGLWFRFQRREWVLYNMALRPVGADRACFVDPVMLEGKECGKRWRQALATALTPDQRQRIRALVTDGFRGGKRIAAENGWALQRCHWHVLATLRGFLGLRRKTTHGLAMRRAIYRWVREALQTPDEARAQELCRELIGLTEHRYCHTRLRYVVSGFVNDIDDFRAYSRHPELKLPRTISSVESKHDQMRDAVSCVRTPQAVLRRIRSLFRLKPSICCRPAKNPQK